MADGEPALQNLPALPPVAAPSRARSERLALVCVWVIVAIPPSLWFGSQRSPEAVVTTVHTATSILGAVLLWGLLGAALAAIFIPPVPAWFRLQFDALRRSLGSDRGPLLRALGELQHFASAQRHFEVGRLARTRGEHALALEHLLAALQLDPRAAATHHQLGLTLFALGHLPHAAHCFANAEALEPGHAFGDALLYTARCADLLDQHGAALAGFERHEQRHGGGYKSRYWHASALDGAGRTPAATQLLQAIAARPERRLSPEENWFRALARVRSWSRRRA